MDRDTGHQLTLLLSSPRVAPGLLSAAAWQALRTADVVLAADPEADQPRAFAAAGVDVGRPPPEVLGSPQALAGALLDVVVGGGSAGGSDRPPGGAARHVVWVGSPDGDPGLAEALAVALPDDDPPALELLVGSWDTPGARLLDAVAVMDRLRSPGGCPWDAEQTHATLAPYLVEEAHEAVEVLEQLDGPASDGSGGHALGGDAEDLRRDASEELGDVLLQVLFHARVAAEHEDDPFDIDDVAAGLVAKLVRRHPHVFAAATGEDPIAADQVEANWETIKAAEKPEREHVLDGIPTGMPSLARAAKVASRLGRAGRGDWLAGWVEQRRRDGDPGAELLSAVLELRGRDVDPDAALRHTLRAVTDATDG